MRLILGIDPGKSGGLSVIDENMNLIATYSMPTVKIGGKDKVCPKGLQAIFETHQIELAVIEKVGARPGQGVVSMFSFGDAYGVVRALAEVYAAKLVYATPQQWKGHQYLIGLSKEQTAEVAFEIFKAPGIYGRKCKNGTPSVKDGISDSLMIAKYGIRLLE